MADFFEGMDRRQTVLLPDGLEDWIGEVSLVSVVDLLIGELDLPCLGFGRASLAQRSGRDDLQVGS